LKRKVKRKEKNKKMRGANMISFDLVIALILIGLILIILLFTQTREQPKKSRRNLVFIASAIGAVFGLTLFRSYRTKSLRKELLEREENLKQQEKALVAIKGEQETSEEELQQLRAKLEEQRAAYEKTILDINTKNKAEKERINDLSGEDLHDEFMTTFSND